MASMVIGKHAMIAKANMPNKIRIEFVLIFMSHLHIVLLMDGALKIKVPRLMPCYKTVTATKIKPFELRTMHILKIATFLMAMMLINLSGCNLQGNSPRVGLKLIAEGFTSPVALITPRDGSGRLFVVDQTGVIWIISEGERIERPFLDLRAQIVELNSFYDERGLLGLAFHPDFATNGRFYISYSAPLQGGLSPDRMGSHDLYLRIQSFRA
jgi:hypothetical protein